MQQTIHHKHAPKIIWDPSVMHACDAMHEKLSNQQETILYTKNRHAPNVIIDRHCQPNLTIRYETSLIEHMHHDINADSTTTNCVYAPHVARRVAISTRAINAIRSNIAMQHAKRNTEKSIRSSGRHVLLSYRMKNYSKSIRLVKNVQSASFPFHWVKTKQFSNHAVVK